MPRTDGPPLAELSLIDDNAGRRVRMSSLAFLGAHKVNGVSELHTELMRQTVFRDLHRLYPDRIVNKTNGITLRRWLFAANPRADQRCSPTWSASACWTTRMRWPISPRSPTIPRCMSGSRASGAPTSRRWRSWSPNGCRSRLTPTRCSTCRSSVSTNTSGSLLNILETIALYNEMRARPMSNWVPRVKIFAGKAAASYHRAKLIIKLINDVANVINNDPAVHGLLKVVFIPDYNVSLAETIIPAADLSEQISTAGMEASGTGNMKLALNGALTIGTLDGANIEIRERVGNDNIFIFGLTADEVVERRRRGPGARETIARLPVLREVLDAIAYGVFSPDEPQRFSELVDELTGNDHFMVSADFAAFAAMQGRVAARWQDRRAWWRSSVLNTARVGWFSSDRAIREYAADIWNVEPRTL